jgi:hypothetical protein
VKVKKDKDAAKKAKELEKIKKNKANVKKNSIKKELQEENIHMIILLWNEAYLQIEMSFVKCYMMII